MKRRIGFRIILVGCLLTPTSAVFAEIRSLWDEYEDSRTATALFVRDMNLIDMCAQALLYESGQRYDPVAETPMFQVIFS